MNEFSQAIDFFRLKISFEDITKLFRFLDTNGNGTIGFGEFKMLDQANWENLKPYDLFKENKKKRDDYIAAHDTDYQSESNDTPKGLAQQSIIAANFAKLEDMVANRNQFKVPIKGPEK